MYDNLVNAQPPRNTDNQADAILQFLDNALNLKEVSRRGWIYHGVPSIESVACHSYGVCLFTLLLIELASEDISAQKALSLAVIHDLCEVETGDITPHDGISTKEKRRLETNAMMHLCGSLKIKTMQALWSEYSDGESRESQLVHDADFLDTLAQTIRFSDMYPDKNFDFGEFWSFAKTRKWTPEGDRLYRVLLRRR